jgi:hypothetical protein
VKKEKLEKSTNKAKNKIVQNKTNKARKKHKTCIKDHDQLKG